MKLFLFCYFFLAVRISFAVDSPSLWEYGIGFGYIQFEQYPTSSQSNYLFFPFPTFQYHGEVIRADDREGTRAYLFKGDTVSVELSGGGHTSLDSSANTAREGMPDLPWMISLGPQVVGQLSQGLELRLKFFQTTATDFRYTRLRGATTESQIIYKHWDEIHGLPTRMRISLAAKTANQEYLATYFEVEPQFARADRPQYESHAGFLEIELNYFQSVKVEKASYYIGVAVHDYSLSANRASPLHKADYTFSFLIGMTYTLGQSQRDSVPDLETEGIIKNNN